MGLRSESAAEPVTTAGDIAAQLGVSERYLYTIKKRQWTSNRRHAEILAKHFGGGWGDWYQPHNRRGRQRNWSAFLMREGAEQFPFRSFVRENANSPDWIMFELGALYEDWHTPEDFERLDSLVTFAMDRGFDLGTAEEAARLWHRFVDWRIDKIARAAKRSKGG
jgi:hypothetical protein